MVRPLTPERTPNKARSRAKYAHPSPQPCGVCGSKPSHRHHHKGYGPDVETDIVWLCPQHHHDAHREMRGGRGIGGGVRPRVNELQRDRALERAREAWRLSQKGHSKEDVAHLVGADPRSVRRWFRKYAKELAS